MSSFRCLRGALPIFFCYFVISNADAQLFQIRGDMTHTFGQWVTVDRFSCK